MSSELCVACWSSRASSPYGGGFSYVTGLRQLTLDFPSVHSSLTMFPSVARASARTHKPLIHFIGKRQWPSSQLYYY